MQQYVNYGLVDYESIHNHPESLNKLIEKKQAAITKIISLDVFFSIIFS